MNILTFDIEEWFHLLDNKSTKSPKEWNNYEYRLESNMDYIFNLLSENNLKASFFCLGWVAREFANIVKKIDQLGFEVGTHSDLHQLIYEQNKSQFKEDLSRSIKSIEDLIGKKVSIYRAPGFSLTSSSEWVFEELINQGIEIDCSIVSISTFSGGFTNFDCLKPSTIQTNNGKIKEFPINLFNFLGRKIIFSGGGYFRFFPYWLIKNMSKNSNYMMAYYHPRDFDKTQPIIKDLSLFRKFRAYYGIHNCYNKLEKFTKDFNFISLGEANQLVDWNKAKTLHLK